MTSNRSRYIAGGLLTVGLSIGAALATPVLASADPSSDPWIDQMLSGLSVPDPAATLDMQVSIDGIDLFPTAGNTATATSDMGNIAIAIGNGAEATDASGGTGDFAFADGANSTAEAGFGGTGDFAFADGANSTAEAGFNGSGDTAVVFGANSTAEAGFGSILYPYVLPLDIFNNSDLAAVFGDTLNASATTGSGLVDILPSL